MTDKSQRLKGRNDILSSLNVAIGGLDLAKQATTVIPAKTVFTSASVLLTTIRVSFLWRMLVDCWLMCAGLDGLQSGLCRTWAHLLRRLRSS